MHAYHIQIITHNPHLFSPLPPLLLRSSCQVTPPLLLKILFNDPTGLIRVAYWTVGKDVSGSNPFGCACGQELAGSHLQDIQKVETL